MGDYPNGSGGTRTPDQFIRSELLYPSELLTLTVVPIAANPEPPRGSPQLGGFPPNSYIIEGGPYPVKPLPVVMRIDDCM